MRCTSDSQWQSEPNSLYQNKHEILHQEDQTYQNQHLSKIQIEEETSINSESMKLLQYFFDTNKFQSLCRGKNNQGQQTQSLWKMYYVLGQTLLRIQKHLVQQQILKQCVLLQFCQIEKVTSLIFHKAKRADQSQSLKKIITLLQQLQKEADASKMGELYSEITKIARKTYQFQMVTDTVHHEQAQTLGQNQNIFDFQIEELQVMPPTKIINQNRLKEKPKVTGNQRKTKKIIQTNQPIERGPRGRLSEADQAIICRAYAETETATECIQILQKQLGLDARWSYPNQIQSRMNYIATKAFNKFPHTISNSPCIQTFLKNRKKVFAVDEITMRRQIFKNIAWIYFNLINKTDNSRKVITQRINEINRLCQEVSL